MNTITQRLREIAVDIGQQNMAAYVKLRAIASELEAQPAGDEAIEALIEESDGAWHEDQFRIDAADLMRLLRNATALSSQRGIEAPAADAPELPKPYDLQHDDAGMPHTLFTAPQMREYAAATVAALQARINALEARQVPLWFLDEEQPESVEEDVYYAWAHAHDAYHAAAGALRGHLEWRDRVRAAVRVLVAAAPSLPQPDSSKERT